jgi:hypothetical protein
MKKNEIIKKTGNWIALVSLANGGSSNHADDRDYHSETKRNVRILL